MPTNTHPDSRFATMTAAQVLQEQDAMLARWAAEDAERRARHAALLGTGFLGHADTL